MKRTVLSAVAAILAVTLVGAASSADGATEPSIAMAQAVDDFQLTDHTRLAQRLYYFAFSPAVVIMTRSNGAPASADAALERLNTEYKPRGVVVWALDSNLRDSREAVAAEVASRRLTIPVLMDEHQLVGEALGVKRDGEVFVIDPRTWRIAYHGPASGAAAALEAVLAGEAVERPRIAMDQGRSLAFPARERAASFAKISYAKQIAPILQEKCVSCHVNGGIGPFAMNSYEIVKGFSPMIRETVRTRRMPPYFADPHVGAFKNDQGLTAEQTKLLVHWIEAGAPRGSGPDPLLLNASRRAPEWPESLGKPDLVVELPAFDVPATGLVEYQNVRVPNPFKTDAWLRAIAMEPGDRSVLHHVTSNHVADRTRPAPAIPGGSVGSYTPGSQPQMMAAGSGAPLPAGGELNFQMHYTTTGKATTDKTKVGFYLLDAPPKYIKRSAVIANFGLMIPPGAARHKEIAYVTFPADAYLYTLYPHAHYRGYHVELKALTPDGRETLLLSLPKYDFNWQRDYDPVKPIQVKAGTKLVATWVYDNSAHNAANPDATRRVTWGEQTPDEMMYFRVNYRWADETVANVRSDLQQQLFRSMLIGTLDANFDDTVRPDELRGTLGAVVKPRFSVLDRDGSGGLDQDELHSALPEALLDRIREATPDL